MRVSLVQVPVPGFVVEEVPHPDAGRVGLKRNQDPPYLSVDRLNGVVSWSSELTGWQGFYPGPTGYTAIMDNGTSLIFPKGQTFA